MVRCLAPRPHVFNLRRPDDWCGPCHDSSFSVGEPKIDWSLLCVSTEKMGYFVYKWVQFDVPVLCASLLLVF